MVFVKIWEKKQRVILSMQKLKKILLKLLDNLLVYHKIINLNVYFIWLLISIFKTTNILENSVYKHAYRHNLLKKVDEILCCGLGELI